MVNRRPTAPLLIMYAAIFPRDGGNTQQPYSSKCGVLSDVFRSSAVQARDSNVTCREKPGLKNDTEKESAESERERKSEATAGSGDAC